jgi:nucleoside-diphosphate-sugar epimerase
MIIDRKGGPFDVVIHLAAMGGVALADREPKRVVCNNVECTMAIVDWMRRQLKPPHLVLASSFSVYGNACPVTEDTPPNPLETYGASKLMQELCFRGSNLPVTILRFSSVYGRSMRIDDNEATILAKIAGWIRRGERPTIFEDGLQSRDFVHVRDIVDAMLTLLASPHGRHPALINVCSGEATTLLDACMMVAGAMGRRCEPIVTGVGRPGDMRHCLGATTRVRALLGRPPTPFDVGVREAFGL